MNREEKEQYLREYEVLKKKGKPFFPYAIMKDSTMALIVVLLIVVDVDLARRRAGSEGRSDHDDLRAAARLVLLLPVRAAAGDQAAELVPIATIGVPTIAMVLLFLLPFYDRNPERNPLKRPIATVAGLLTIASMAFLTFLGANAGSPTDIDIDVAPEYNAGKLIAAQSGCLACHQFGENGNNGPGPKLTEIGARLNPAAIARSLEIGPGIMPSYAAMAEDEPEKFRDLVAFLGSLNGQEMAEPSSTGSPGNPDAALPDESGGNPAAVEPAGGSSP